MKRSSNQVSFRVFPSRLGRGNPFQSLLKLTTMGIEISKLLTNAQINDLAVDNGYEYRVLKSIIQVESDQHGFHPVTGKIIIQFEPGWFKWLYKNWAAATKY